VDDLKDRSAEFEASGYFRTPALRRYQWDITLDADEYVALLQTASWYRRLDDDVRRQLFERIHERIRARPRFRPPWLRRCTSPSARRPF
jgi:hypothetical protein